MCGQIARVVGDSVEVDVIPLSGHTTNIKNGIHSFSAGHLPAVVICWEKYDAV